MKTTDQLHDDFHDFCNRAKVTHTPGPWLREGTFVWALHVPPDPTFKDGKPIEVNRFQFSVQGNGRHGASEEELLAVARVAQAAPDLLAACKTLVDWDTEHEGMYSEHNPAVKRVVVQAQMALAKAKGEL